MHFVIQKDDDGIPTYLDDSGNFTDHLDSAKAFSKKYDGELPEGCEWAENWIEEADASFDHMDEHNPLMDKTTGTYLDFDPREEGGPTREEFEAAVDKKLVWSLVDGEGFMWAMPGIHIVNNLRYLKCEIPYKR